MDVSTLLSVVCRSPKADSVVVLVSSTLGGSSASLSGLLLWHEHSTPNLHGNDGLDNLVFHD